MKSGTTLAFFQEMQSRAELASHLKIKHSQLVYLLYKSDPDSRYETFEIPKKSGGSRTINAPSKNLKTLQKRLGEELQKCLTEIQSKPLFKNNASHGFRPKRSILTNAAVHRNKRYVFNVDLKDFFPSITGQRIRGFLIKDTNFGFHKDVATTIAHIACDNGVLPQGSPCSPVISNIIAVILDFHLSRLAKQFGCIYTRYADDITFSTNKKIFPSAIAKVSANDPHDWTVGKQLSGLISKSGFEINHAKTRMQYMHSRQMVTGLIVNKRINVPSEYKKLIRAYVFSLVNHGSFEIKKPISAVADEPVYESSNGSTNQLHGMLAFMHSVENVYKTEVLSNSYNYPVTSLAVENNRKIKPSGNLILFRRFLFYVRMHAAAKPLIICEGKTDNVYYSNAAHKLKSYFPQLIERNDEGKDVLAFQFLKYARRHKKTKHVYLPNFSTISILGGGSGGNPNQFNLILNYKNERSRFRTPVSLNPVIFIVDNDAGGRELFNKLRTNGHTIDPQLPFTHLFANCYVVPVPSFNGQNSNAESLFKDEDKNASIDGKVFNFEKDNDTETTIGKAGFAYNYVVKKADSIDWTGFIPLMQNIVECIGDCQRRTTQERVDIS